MSVPEMADLLGLKSGTAYDLVKRGYFETILIDMTENTPFRFLKMVLY